MSSPDTGSIARPRRRWRSRFALASVALVGLLAFGFWLDHYLEERAWRAACAEADRLDPGWRWDDLLAARPNPPDDRNAAVRIQAIMQKLPQGWPDWAAAIRDEDLPPSQEAEPLPSKQHLPPGLPAPAQESVEDRRRRAGYDLEQSLWGLVPNQVLRPAQVAALRGVLAAAGDSVEQARGLNDLAGGRLPGGFTSPVMFNLPLADFRGIHIVADLLSQHARLQAHDGRIDEALASSRAVLGTARVAAATPTQMNAMLCLGLREVAIGSVERTLGQGEPSPAALQATREALEAEAARPLLRDSLRGGRAMIEEFARAVDAGRASDDEIDSFDSNVSEVTGHPTIDRWLHRLRGGGWRKRNGAALVRYYTALIERAKASPDALGERPDAVGAAVARLPARLREDYETGIDQLHEDDRCSRMLLHSAAAAVAVEHFRRDTGRWPASLEELVPAYLKAVPRDSFDLKPLCFRKLADGVVIYSVGSDRTDDGGEVRIDPKVGGTLKDLGVRLWDPEHRRRPPPSDQAGR
jgi:hypothetical protein